MAISPYVKVFIDRRKAEALAQFVKRADRDTARRHAGDQAEADLIYEAWIEIREELAQLGISPR